MSTATTHASETKSHGNFISERLGSALAIAPLGVWTLNHLWNNLHAFESGPAWQKAVTEYPHPLAEGITLAVVLLPLVWHTVWGLGRIFQTRPNYPRYGYFANFKYVLQRIAGIGVLGFLGAHLWLAFLQPRLIKGHVEPFADIAHEMRFHMPTLVVYLLGVLGTAYHLGNGVHSAMMTWGVAATRRSLGRWEILAWAVFLVALIMGWGAVYALYQGGAQT